MKAIISVTGANDDGARIEISSVDELERVTEAYDRIELDYSIQYVNE